jgi:hypothetical protein
MAAGAWRHAVAAAVLGAALLAACGPRPDPADRVSCPQGPGFIGDGQLPLDAGLRGDAALLQSLRHEVVDGCERVTLGLARADGMPAATPGQVQAELRRDLGVIRVSLLDVDQVSPTATDARFDGPLGRAAWVVRSPDGPWLYTDVQLGDAAEAQVRLGRDPARIEIDLRPGGGPLPAPPAISTRTVVLAPRPGRSVYPLTITGHARTFEANVVARLEQQGTSHVEAFTTATGYLDAWGAYTLTLDDGPAGPVTLHVGEYSARDGTWEGVAIDLDLRH